MTSYAEAGEAGTWLDVRIDTAVPDKGDPDLRKWLVPLGPVVVFGASNFPFAYSTAGGDTASALAAGCPVIVKAHPAHAETSEIVAGAIARAVKAEGLPAGVFAHVHGAGTETGKTLVTHPHTRAVGFTGSYGGGKALFDWANQRKVPIPVFAEMGSINPIFILPGKLAASAKELAATLAGSITLGVGQFCTNPGLIIGIEGPDLDLFIEELGTAIASRNAGNNAPSGNRQSLYGKARCGPRCGRCRHRRRRRRKSRKRTRVLRPSLRPRRRLFSGTRCCIRKFLGRIRWSSSVNTPMSC